MTSSSIDWGMLETVSIKRAKQAEAEHQMWKAARQQAVDTITVEVDGLRFDGNEISQNRIARAIAASDSPEQMLAWTLADNMVVTVTVLQLKKALVLASTKQTEIWNNGRPSL